MEVSLVSDLNQILRICLQYIVYRMVLVAFTGVALIHVNRLFNLPLYSLLEYNVMFTKSFISILYRVLLCSKNHFKILYSCRLYVDQLGCLL